MEASDLMKGFIVNTPKGIGKVIQAHDNGASVEVDGKWNNYYYNELSFTKITTEILEKNGFKRHNRDEYIYEDNCCKVCVSIGVRVVINGVDLGEAPINVAIDGALFDINMIMSAIYELQLAFKLCGIDKQITI